MKKREQSSTAIKTTGGFWIDTSGKTNSAIQMPCSYSDEDFKKEIALSEKSGFVSDKEFKQSCFARWNVVL